jgi:predicted homoserine dehydrogenase-like protein
MAKISVIGSGFIAKGFINLLHSHPYHTLEKILTRTSIGQREDVAHREHLTNDLDALISTSDLIVECTGDAIYATETISKILKAGIPVVTMNSEFHITTGSFFTDKGLLTEAEGDQPGVLAMMHEEAVSMGFKPLVYGNIKGFLNHNPTLEEMQYWSKRSGISLNMVTSFTDGTKVQIEQAFVANGLHAGIAQDGLLGYADDDMQHGGDKLAEKAKELGYPISDYLLSPKLPAGVFLVAEHHADQKDGLRYYKMGDGPFYVLERTFHLCHLEIMKTVDRILNGGGVLLDNSAEPSISVTTIAKRDLTPGEKIAKGIGSFDVRGIAVRIEEHPGHVPIGLMKNAVIKRPVAAGTELTFDDVELPESMAQDIWKQIEKKVLDGKRKKSV